MANINLHLKDYYSVIEDCNKALLYQPDLALAFYNRGAAKFILNDKNGACEDWGLAVKNGYDEAKAKIDQYCK